MYIICCFKYCVCVLLHSPFWDITMSQSYNKMSFNRRVVILNLFLFRTLRQTLINKNKLFRSLSLVQEQICMQTQKFNLNFPSPSSELGKTLSTIETKLVLDMKRMCPFIFQTTPSPSYFRVSDSYMTVHLQLFQVLLHNNNVRL